MAFKFTFIRNSEEKTSVQCYFTPHLLLIVGILFYFLMEKSLRACITQIFFLSAVINFMERCEGILRNSAILSFCILTFSTAETQKSSWERTKTTTKNKKTTLDSLCSKVRSVVYQIIDFGKWMAFLCLHLPDPLKCPRRARRTQWEGVKITIFKKKNIYFKYLKGWKNTNRGLISSIFIKMTCITKCDLRSLEQNLETPDLQAPYTLCARFIGFHNMKFSLKWRRCMYPWDLRLQWHFFRMTVDWL